MLAIILLIGLQFLSGCGGCGGSDDEEATVGVEGEACPDVGKVTVSAYGVHYPCDMCANPVQTILTSYDGCGTGYSAYDWKSYKEEISCNTSGPHVITYTDVMHGGKNELGFSSYTYDLGSGSATFSNVANNPLKDGCAEDAGGGDCAVAGPYGINFPCDACDTPVESEHDLYVACDPGYKIGEVKGFKATINCNVIGSQVIVFTNIKYGQTNELGYSSYDYSGAATGSYNNSSTNPPKDGCTEEGILECSSPFDSSYVNPTQWGANIRWPCPLEETPEIPKYIEKYTANITRTDGYNEVRGYEKTFARSFKCPDCETSGEWGYGVGTDRFLVIMTNIGYCGIEPAYAKYDYEVWTADIFNTKVALIYGPITDKQIVTCQ